MEIKATELDWDDVIRIPGQGNKKFTVVDVVAEGDDHTQVFVTPAVDGRDWIVLPNEETVKASERA